MRTVAAIPPEPLLDGVVPMSSIVAILLLGLMIGGGVAYAVARYIVRWSPGERCANARPPLMVLVAVLGASLAGWLVAEALLHD